MTKDILLAYGLSNTVIINPFGHGLINRTWKIEDAGIIAILQKINTDIFKKPEFISENIYAIANYLSIHHPDYFFPIPYQTIDGKDLYINKEGSYRMFPFIKNSHTINVADNATQTREAARKFGELTKMLHGFPVNSLKITLPDFHNITLRYKDFSEAKQNGNKERIAKAAEIISYLESQENIVSEFEKIKLSKEFKLRVTHHDTKINNVLFNENDEGICVIDLDTLMPGYFISDIGDMIRTHVPPVDENEKDLSEIIIRKEYFVAVAQGYLSEMHDELSSEELNHFVFAGKFMIYMQALRFLTDYLNNDVYYGRSYESHNFDRAANQSHLLKLLTAKEQQFSSIVFEIAEEKMRSSKERV